MYQENSFTGSKTAGENAPFFLFKSGSSHEPELFVLPGYIAHGDDYFVPRISSNRILVLHSLSTHAKEHHTRIWTPRGRYLVRKSAPRRAMGALL